MRRSAEKYVAEDTKYDMGWAGWANIPAGTLVIPATNLPEKGKYWAEDWPGMNETEESWGRNYGFLLEGYEVTDVKPGQMDMDESIVDKLAKRVGQKRSGGSAMDYLDMFRDTYTLTAEEEQALESKGTIPRSAIDYAAWNNHIDMMQSLISRGAVIPKSAVTSAARKGHVEMLQLLLRNGGVAS